MACGCTSGVPSVPGSWTVHYDDGSSESYRSEVEAISAAANSPGAWAVPAR